MVPHCRRCIVTMTRDEIIQIINEVLAASGLRSAAVEPVEPVEPVVADPPPQYDGPFSAGLAGIENMLNIAEQVDGIAAVLCWRFTRADVYAAMAEVIERHVGYGSDWVLGSEDSWRWTAEAFRTRAAELNGDKMTTKIPALTVTSVADFGIGERALLALDLIVREVAGQYGQQRGDADLGPNGELLTTGECVRLCYCALNSAIKTGVLPNEGAFQDVRKELYAQYNAMGEGRFGPFNVPGGPVPWSWGGGA